MTSPSDVTFVGFTDKSELKERGRHVVENNELLVEDGSAPAGDGTAYYVDADDGDDGNGGTSAATAWQTFENVNAMVFEPGDSILLKAGSSWMAEGDEVAGEAFDYTTWSGGNPTHVVGPDLTALLAPQGSGTADDPIVLSSYGDGVAPKLIGRGVVNDVLLLSNQEHWNISNLDISNETEGFDPSQWEAGGLGPGQEHPLTGDLRGIHVQGESAGTLRGFEIHNVYIHDISGVTWSISHAGLDRSKRTGGILFEGLKGDNVTVSQLEDIIVRDSYIANTSFGNLNFRQFAGMGTNRYQDLPPGWGDRAVGRAAPDGTLTEDPDWRPHKNIQIVGNYMTNKDTQYGWNSMYLTSVQNATVEDNVIDGAGVSGIEMYYADNIVVQDNEVSEVLNRTHAADSNGIDPDRGASNILIQGNFVHQSGEGILLATFGFGTAIIRYNIIQDAHRNYINPHGDRGVTVIYNNLMYNTRVPQQANTVNFFNSSGSQGSFLNANNPHYLFNNVFVNTRSTVSGAQFRAGFPGVEYGNNSYFGPNVVAPDEDPNAIIADPLLGGVPTDDLRNALPTSHESPLISAGVDVDLSQLAPGMEVTGHSGQSQLPLSVDFFGTGVSLPPTVGPSTYLPAEGHGIVSGIVHDEDGFAVPEATVSYSSSTATADATGRYSFEAPVGEYSLIPSAEGFADGDPVTVTLSDGQLLAQDLTLGETTATEGTIAGTVVTLVGTAIEDVTVTVSNSDETVATATTDTDGEYVLNEIPSGDGYTVSAAKDGYETASQSDVTVRAVRTVIVDLALRAATVDPGVTTYVINETFDDEATGTFTQTSNGQLIARTTGSPVGTFTVVEDAAQLGNKYLRINKATNNQGAMIVQNVTAQNLSGIVTMEARVQRTTTNGPPNQLAMYSYTDSDWNPANPPSSPNPAATFGFANGQIMTHNVTGASSVRNVAPYTVGQWYVVRNVANLNNGTFDIYVDDMTTPVLADQPLRTLVEELDWFQFFINTSNVGDLLIDYFRVNTGAPYDYDDSSLESVSAESADGEVELSVSPDGPTYSGSVHAFAEDVTITPTAGSAFAQVAVNGTDVASGGSVEITLEDGEPGDSEFVTDIPVVVTAEDGSQSHYTVSISRTNPNRLAVLRTLSVEGFDLSPEFSYDRHGADVPYEVIETVDSSVASVTLTWERGWNGQQVQVNGQLVAAEATEATVDLEDGENVIEIAADSFPGDSSTYVVTLTREAAEPDIPCSQIIDGNHTGPLSISDGVTCLEGAKVTGPVTVATGAGLRATGSRITGPVTANGALEMVLCDTRVTGPVTTTASLVVTLGDPGDDCGGNTVTGSVTVNNTAGPSVVAGNRVVGPLACSGNDPAPVNNGNTNDVVGPKGGQCADL